MNTCIYVYTHRKIYIHRETEVSLTNNYLSFLQRDESIQPSKSLRTINLMNLSLVYLVLKMVLY